MPLELIVCGAAGRMGGAVIRAIRQAGDVALCAAIDKPGSPRLGRDAGEVAGAGPIGVKLTDRIEPHLDRRAVVIDFTNPAASLGYLKAAARAARPIVIATTGFSAGQRAAIARLARRTPALLAANTSLGVAVLTGIVGRVARALGDDYDIEVIEAHHRFKKDAPSGTALALAGAVARALGRDLDRVSVSGRKGLVGERTRREIALLSVRAGDIVGEHTVIFGGIGERLELTHRAHSRETFARGALRAARWLATQKPGLYRIEDALGLK
ncbi:MAG TPA: 4-hydroxy-tetrahydrodipicolinate reductase [Candidatus Eisenbacteria bacterium]|nr:4-hydroxy-tetrahydrodipicolinate reductase [Candidatus Eisenbacteria bacterium]